MSFWCDISQDPFGGVLRYLPLFRVPALLAFMYLAVGSRGGMFHVFPSIVCGVFD